MSTPRGIEFHKVLAETDMIGECFIGQLIDGFQFFRDVNDVILAKDKRIEEIIFDVQNFSI